MLEILDRAAMSSPFQRLIAAPGPVRSAHSPWAGQGFAVAVLARALDVPVLAIAPDPRAADALAAGAGAFLGREVVVRFPAWE